MREWQCEGCDAIKTVKPTQIKTYPGRGEEIQLWFCDACSGEYDD